MKSKLFVMCLYETFMYDIVQLIKCHLLQLWISCYIYLYNICHHRENNSVQYKNMKFICEIDFKNQLEKFIQEMTNTEICWQMNHKFLAAWYFHSMRNMGGFDCIDRAPWHYTLYIIQFWIHDITISCNTPTGYMCNTWNHFLIYIKLW